MWLSSTNSQVTSCKRPKLLTPQPKPVYQHESSMYYSQKNRLFGLSIRIKQSIINNKPSKMKSKILTTCLQGNYRDSLREFSNTPFVVFRT